jgi:polysaccharide export outer membrane protein
LKLKLLLSVLLLFSFLLTTNIQGQDAASVHPSSTTGNLSSNSPDVTAPSFQDRYPRYKIHVGDVLDLSFQFTPEFNQTLTVQPDGFVSLRGIGDIRVQDRTTREISDLILKGYARILRDPVLTIELKEFEKPYFIVGGQVAKPGKYDLRDDTTVIQAISIAGGFSPKSKKSEALLFRRTSDEWVEVQKIDLKRMLVHHELSEDPHLRPGDMVLIPQSKIPDLTPS